MKILTKIAYRYMHVNFSKIRIAFISVLTMMLLLSIILGVANGMGSFFSRKYEALGNQYILMKMDGYSAEVESNLHSLCQAKITVVVESEYFDENFYYKLISTSDEYFYVGNDTFINQTLLLGRSFFDYERHNPDRNILISYQGALNRFGIVDQLGMKLDIGDTEYQVVGIFKKRTDEQSPLENMTPKVEIYAPLSYKWYEKFSTTESIYYISDFDRETSNYISQIKEIAGDSLISITSKEEVNQSLQTIERYIKMIFGGVCVLSAFAVLIVLLSTLQNILQDMSNIFTYYKIIGISNRKLQGIMCSIEIMLVFSGIFLSVIIEMLLATVVIFITGINAFLEITDILVIAGIGFIIILISWLLTRKKISEIRIMDYFRN